MTRTPRCLVILLTACLSAVLVTSAQAQRPDRGPRPQRGPDGPRMWQQPGGNLLRLLRLEQIQKELGLSEEQRTKIKELMQSAREEMQEKRESLREKARELRDAKPEERKTRREAMRKTMEEHAAVIRGKIEAVLDSSQLERLLQIVLQLAGPAALTREDVAQKLDLSDEQQQKIKDLQKGLREKMKEVFGSMKDLDPQQRQEKRGEVAEKLKALRAEALGELMGVLTPEQKQKLEELKGESFELSPPKQRDSRPERRRPRGGKRGPQAEE